MAKQLPYPVLKQIFARFNVRPAPFQPQTQQHDHRHRSGQAVLIGFPEKESEHMADDKMLREMASDPQHRKVLVTDGKSAVGQAVVKALVKAGADIVWVGHAEPWKKLPGFLICPYPHLADISNPK